MCVISTLCIIRVPKRRNMSTPPRPCVQVCVIVWQAVEVSTRHIASPYITYRDALLHNVPAERLRHCVPTIQSGNRDRGGLVLCVLLKVCYARHVSTPLTRAQVAVSAKIIINNLHPQIKHQQIGTVRLRVIEHHQCQLTLKQI